VKRLSPIFLAIFVVLACAACGGGGGKHAVAGKQALPAALVQQIRAEIRKPSVIGGAESATSVDVYGPATYTAIDKAWEHGAGAMTQLSGRWYLIVLHGHFQWRGSVPPGATAAPAQRDVALVAWSPNAHGRGTGYTMAKRVPRAVSRLGAPAAISLS
jgi:hypothetical protein